MHLRQFFLFLSSLPSMTNAFSLSVGTASECDPFTVSWTGGENPFEIYTFSVNDTPRSYSVPSSAYSGNQGSYTIPQFPVPQGNQFVLVMSDATGFATVGTTGVITVAASTSGSSCNTTFPYQFFFSESGSLDQCESYAFYDYPNAILPVYFLGIIPGGESLVLQSDVTAVDYSWTVEVPAGTAMMFSMFDSQNNTGGCSTIQTVGPSPSNDASCLSPSSPSSTAGIAQTAQAGSPSSSTSQIGSSPSTSLASSSSSTSLASSSPSTNLTSSSPSASVTGFGSSTSTTGSGSSQKLSTAALVGIVVGIVFALAALVSLGLRVTQKKHKTDSKNFLSTSHSVPLLHSSDPLHEPDAFAIALAYPFTYQLDYIQPRMPPGQTTSSMTHLPQQGTYNLPHSSTSLLGSPSTDININNFAACDNMGISPLSPSASGWSSMTAATSSISTPDLVHTDIEATLPTASQVLSPPPQYLDMSGPGEQRQQSPLRPLS